MKKNLFGWILIVIGCCTLPWMSACEKQKPSSETGSFVSEITESDSSEDSRDSSNDETEDVVSSVSVWKESDDLTELCYGRKGILNVDIAGIVSLQTSESELGSFLGADGIREIVFSGSETDSAILAKGVGTGAIQATGTGKLIFKDLEIYDECENLHDINSANVFGLEFGGNLRFENVIFHNSILLRDNTNTEFVNCTFNSNAQNQYDVWMADGNVTFSGCTFEGYRGLKIHEDEAKSLDVVSVLVDSCTFKDLSVKPGLAIGDIVIGLDTTTITVKNSNFIGCQPWKRDSLEGIDGFYESDTDTRSFGFSYKGMNNTVDGDSLDNYEPEGNLR